MGYFKEWTDRLNDPSDPRAAKEFMDRYYQMETDAYDTILRSCPHPSGTAAELAEQLGFGTDMIVFTGFLDGIQTSLKNPTDLDALVDDTDVDLDIDFEKLFWNMHDAKADWLYGLESWSFILPVEKQEELTREFHKSQMAVRSKPGRNDPCPCGSGKKYKKCCGK